VNQATTPETTSVVTDAATSVASASSSAATDVTSSATAAIETATSEAAVETSAVETSAVESVEWLPLNFGGPVADAVLSVVTAGETTTLFYPQGDNTFRTMASTAGGPFTSKTIMVAGAQHLYDLRAVATNAGMIAVYSDVATFLPRVLTSTDGVTFSEVATTGLDQPADISRLAAADDAVYAAGALRTGSNPNVGPFAAAMWRSVDGVSWAPVALPVAGGQESYITGLIAEASSIVVTMGSSILRSTDQGATWIESSVTLPAGVTLGSVASVVSDGETMVATGSTTGDFDQQQLVTLRSLDKGQSWEATVVPDDGPGLIGMFDNIVTSAGGAFWLATRRGYEGQPDDCYRDIDRCKRGSDAVLLRSDDGVVWQEVDLTKLDATGYIGIVGVVDRPTGAMVVGTTRMLFGWTWPSDDAPPLVPPYPVLPPLEQPLIEFNGTLTVGTLYRFPTFLHCGIGYLGDFNGQQWIADPASIAFDPQTGDIPADWPVAQQELFGYITLVDSTTIEYSLPSGEVIARFHPTDVQPDLCA
jgi:hypothetical protein